MGAINFAGLRRLLDYKVTSVIQHCTISRIMPNYAGKTDHAIFFLTFSITASNQLLGCLKLFSVIVF